MTCSIGWLKGVAKVVFLEMGKKFMENDFFKDSGQKWKVRNGAVVIQIFLSSDVVFRQRFDDDSLQITWYIASGKRCAHDVRDGWQEDVKVFIKKRGGNGIKFTRLGGCTVGYF